MAVYGTLEVVPIESDLCPAVCELHLKDLAVVVDAYGAG